MGAVTGGGGMSTRLKPIYCPPPHFYHNIDFDWLLPPTYKIVPAP